MKRGALLDYGIAVVAVVIALLLQAYVVKPCRIPSESMANTLRHGDRVLVNRLAHHLSEPRRGDVVVFRYPRQESIAFIKRIIGLPGDRLQAKDGRLYVNGHATAEPDVHRTAGFSDPTEPAPPPDPSTMRSPWSLAEPCTVPAGTYFVMGDSRTDCDDSRGRGVVPADDLIGEGFVVHWPTNHWSAL